MISTAELAKAIHRHTNTVLAWAGNNLIPCTRRNKRVILFDPAAVQVAMEKNNLKPGSKKRK